MCEQLFPYLDANEQRAWERYGTICCKLITFFENKITVDPVDCLNKTFDRVVENISKGKIDQIPIEDNYFLKVAWYIFKESWRKAQNTESIEDLSEGKIPPTDTEEEEDENLERVKKEQRLECLDKCMKELPENLQKLIINFHKCSGAEGIRIRKKMAKKLKITGNALRIKANRIRAKLGICLDNCLAQTTPGEWIKLLLGNNWTIVKGFDYE